jgi:hypothetical protein
LREAMLSLVDINPRFKLCPSLDDTESKADAYV